MRRSGVDEVPGALLLALSTTPLGALVLVPVLANVVAINFAYDGDVKLPTTIYVLVPPASTPSQPWN